jgi:hypothetical protein
LNSGRFKREEKSVDFGRSTVKLVPSERTLQVNVI